MVDLQKGFEHALAAYPEIDRSRTAAAGASYGGYAVNWLAGNQERYGFDFKALVTHDGVRAFLFALPLSLPELNLRNNV